MTTPLLVFTTDFGLFDSYAGVMKGVALGINPDLRFIDLTHQVTPQSVGHGSFVLGVSYRYFPKDAIHVAVVDPGVGTSRRPILLETPHGRFVAPDNGLLSRVISEYLPGPPISDEDETVALPVEVKAYHLTNSEYWLHPVSSTFHGRDIFTPVAAHLSLGVPPESMGEPTNEMAWLPLPQPRVTPEGVRGEIIYCDIYGNLISNIPATLLNGEQVGGLDGEQVGGLDGGQVGRRVAEVRIRGRSIRRLNRTFHDGNAPGTLIALFGSHGYLEVAVASGNAAAVLQAGIGEPLTVTFSSPSPQSIPLLRGFGG